MKKILEIVIGRVYFECIEIKIGKILRRKG